MFYRKRVHVGYKCSPVRELVLISICAVCNIVYPVGPLPGDEIDMSRKLPQWMRPVLALLLPTNSKTGSTKRWQYDLHYNKWRECIGTVFPIIFERFSSYSNLSSSWRLYLHKIYLIGDIHTYVISYKYSMEIEHFTGKPYTVPVTVHLVLRRKNRTSMHCLWKSF